MGALESKTLAVVLGWVRHHCVVPDGFHKGRRFRPYDYQTLYLANFYLVCGDAVFDPHDPILSPAFVYRRGLLVGPQKVGKDPLAAAHICVEGVGPAVFAGWAGSDAGYACSDHGCGCGWEWPYQPGEPMGMRWPTPLIQITAVSEEQTGNTYDALRPMIDDGPLHDLIPKTGEEFIRLPGGGRIDAVTASAQSRLGQRVTFVSQGEVGLWTRSNRMTKVADTQYRGLAGMGGRASLNTNAWDPSEESVAQQQYESKAEDIYRQFVEPPKSLSFTNKQERRKIYRIVYPTDTLRANGGHIDLDSIEAEAIDLIDRDPTQAERFFGNRVVTGQADWMDAEAWKKQGAPDLIVGEREQITLGFDGSLGAVQSRRKPDATGLGACRVEDGHLFTILIDEAEKPDLDGFWTWEPDRAALDRILAETFERYDVVLMWADPQHWQNDIGRWAVEYGANRVVERWTNNDAWMSQELERLYTAVINGNVTHDASEQATRHVLNAQRHVKRGAADPDGRRDKVLVTKKHRNSPEKIDMVPTWTLAYAARAHVLDKGLHRRSGPAPLYTHRLKAR